MASQRSGTGGKPAQRLSGQRHVVQDQPTAQPHGGRLQAQGSDIREPGPSFSWARNIPLPRPDAIAGLLGVYEECTAEQRERRELAFAKARRFIEQGPHEAVMRPVLRSFFNRNLPERYRNARVDVEIQRGQAFT